MTDSKKISELTKTTNLADDDEFVVIDKSSTTGADASTSGKTSVIRFDDLKSQIGSQNSLADLSADEIAQIKLFLQHWKIDSNGHLLPKEPYSGGYGSTGGVDLGSAEHKVRHVFRSDA